MQLKSGMTHHQDYRTWSQYTVTRNNEEKEASGENMPKSSNNQVAFSFLSFLYVRLLLNWQLWEDGLEERGIFSEPQLELQTTDRVHREAKIVLDIRKNFN